MEISTIVLTLVVLVTVGAFFLGITMAWLAKGYVEDYIENAAYAKSVTHPERLDEDGNLLHDELIYVRPATPWDELPEQDEDDD